MEKPVWVFSIVEKGFKILFLQNQTKSLKHVLLCNAMLQLTKLKFFIDQNNLRD